MSTDPFAAVSAAEANEALADNTHTNTPTQKETTVSNTLTNPSQAKIVATLKGGSGFDAPWIVVHADTPEEAVDSLKDPAMKELLELTQNVAGKFVEMGPAKPAAAPARGNGQPAAAAAAPGGQTPPEGYMFKSGVSKTGKTWKAYMPIDRNSGLEVIWL